MRELSARGLEVRPAGIATAHERELAELRAHEAAAAHRVESEISAHASREIDLLLADLRQEAA